MAREPQEELVRPQVVNSIETKTVMAKEESTINEEQNPTSVITDLLSEEKTVEEIISPHDDREVVSIAENETSTNEPARQAVDRIADEAIIEPDSTINEGELQFEVAKTQTDEEIIEVVEPVIESAQQETATEIVTEAEKTNATALVISRPQRRPLNLIQPIESEPAAKEQPVFETVREEEAKAQSPPQNRLEIDFAALIMQDQEERIASEVTNSIKSSVLAPLTISEREGLKRVLKPCWNILQLSDAAKYIVITVEFELERDGRPIERTIKMINASSNNELAVANAFKVSKRAIMRCLIEGYDLPAEKYDRWRKVEIVFNPEEMRNR